MYIIGIEPKAPGLHIFAKGYMPRLGLPLLLTIAEQMGHQCQIFCEEIAPIQWDIVEKADLVLMSTITSTAPRTYDQIKKIKEINPRAPVLIGGPHVTFLTEEALKEGADYVFRHEADESFSKFLKWSESKNKNLQELFEIFGLSFKIGDRFQHNPDPLIVDLDTLPTPNLDLIFRYSKPDVIPIITSRGCPHNCEFCSETAMSGRKYRFRSEQKIIEDIRYYDRRYGKTSIFIADDNLGANPLRLERLCQAIIDNGLVRPLTGQIRLDLAKRPQTLAIMARAGFERVCVGYESTNPQSLEEMGKGLKYEEMEEYTRIIHQFNIAIHAMWVAGFDHDTLETVWNNLRASIKWLIETTQILILGPSPGADLYKRLIRENRIFNWDYTKWDGHHAVFYTKNMTPFQLQVAVLLEAMPKLYNLWQTARIFVINNWRLVTGFLRPNWHPIREMKRNVYTLLVRLWGKYATWRAKKPVRKYLQEIALLMKKARS